MTKTFQKQIVEKHISQISAGDTVIHEGVERTVCKKDIHRDGFYKYLLFGDSYNCGFKNVQVIVYPNVPRP